MSSKERGKKLDQPKFLECKQRFWIPTNSSTINSFDQKNMEGGRGVILVGQKSFGGEGATFVDQRVGGE